MNIWRDIPAAKRRQNADLRVLLATRRAERERDQMALVDAVTDTKVAFTEQDDDTWDESVSQDDYRHAARAAIEHLRGEDLRPAPKDKSWLETEA